MKNILANMILKYFKTSFSLIAFLQIIQFYFF